MNLFMPENPQKDELHSLQCSILCDHLVELFQDGLSEEIHHSLQQQGLFLPDETVDVEQLKQHNVWDCVQQEFIYLQKNGMARLYRFIFSQLPNSKR